MTRKGKSPMTTATLITDRVVANAYRVESIDDDGGCEVAIFSGPNALDRAVIFAGAVGGYYDGYADPEGLSERSTKLNP